MALLEDPHRLPDQRRLKGYSLTHRLWHYPAFHNSSAWYVYRQQEGESAVPAYIARQLIWDSAHDSNRMFHPMEGLKHGFSVKPTLKLIQYQIS
jgi:hypothetical protein